MRNLILGVLLLAMPAMAFRNGVGDRITLDATHQIGTYYTYILPGFGVPGTNRGILYSNNGASVFQLAQKGSSLLSILATGLADKGFHHLMILNETAYPLSIALTNDVTIVPGSTSPAGGSYQNQVASTGISKYYVLSQSMMTLDNVAIQDSIYVMSENGQSVNTGTLTWSVFGAE